MFNEKRFDIAKSDQGESNKSNAMEQSFKESGIVFFDNNSEVALVNNTETSVENNQEEQKRHEYPGVSDFIAKSEQPHVIETSPENKWSTERLDIAEKNLNEVKNTLNSLQKELEDKQSHIDKIQIFFGKIGFGHAYKELQALEREVAITQQQYNEAKISLQSVIQSYEAQLNNRENISETSSFNTEKNDAIEKDVAEKGVINREPVGNMVRIHKESEEIKQDFAMEESVSVPSDSETIINRDPSGPIVKMNKRDGKLVEAEAIINREPAREMVRTKKETNAKEVPLDEISDSMWEKWVRKNKNNPLFFVNEKQKLHDVRVMVKGDVIEDIIDKRGTLLGVMQEVSFGNQSVWKEIRNMSFDELRNKKEEVYQTTLDVLKKYQDYLGIEDENFDSNKTVERKLAEVVKLYFDQKGW